MVRAENLIVEGECFFNMKFDPQNLMNLKSTIKELMFKMGYSSNDPSPILFQDRFLSMDFFPNRMFNKPSESSLKTSLKRIFSGERKILSDNYFANLKATLDEVPFDVNISLLFGRLKENEGFVIRIRSEPTIISKARQLGFKTSFDEFTYSIIIENNKHFIIEIMTAIGATITKEPKAKSEYIKTPTIDRLESLGFDKIASLMKNGKMKIERGDIEDGLTDLRSSLEMFIKALVEKIGEKPNEQQKLRENLDILKNKGYIEEKIISLINNILCSWLYQYLSDKPVHKREKLNLKDAEFLFSVFEECAEYLLNKVIYRF